MTFQWKPKKSLSRDVYYVDESGEIVGKVLYDGVEDYYRAEYLTHHYALFLTIGLFYTHEDAKRAVQKHWEDILRPWWHRKPKETSGKP